MRIDRWRAAACGLAAALVAGCGDEYEEDDLRGSETGVAESVRTTGEEYAYGQWDADGDRALDREEFALWAGEQRWGDLDRQGFTETAHGLWDTGDDGTVTEAEWNDGAQRWFGRGADIAPWAEWDGDGNGDLDVDELASGFEASGLYGRVDLNGDAVFDDDELTDWWFGIWDLNDDDTIDSTEWQWGDRAGYTRIGEAGVGVT